MQPSDGLVLLVPCDARLLGGVFDDLDRLVIGSPVNWVWDAVFASVGKAVLFQSIYGRNERIRAIWPVCGGQSP